MGNVVQTTGVLSPVKTQRRLERCPDGLLSPFVPLQVQKLSKNEVLMVNIGSLSTGGRVSAVKADLAKIVLTNPVCTEVGEKIALSRRVEKHWR